MPAAALLPAPPPPAAGFPAAPVPAVATSAPVPAAGVVALPIPASGAVAAPACPALDPGAVATASGVVVLPGPFDDPPQPHKALASANTAAPHALLGTTCVIQTSNSFGTPQRVSQRSARSKDGPGTWIASNGIESHIGDAAESLRRRTMPLSNALY